MEKTFNIEKKDNNQHYNENITLTNRKELHLNGIIEIISTSDNSLYLKLKDTHLCISGENIHICKLDVNAGTLEAEGNFLSFKYGKTGNIFKRVFK